MKPQDKLRLVDMITDYISRFEVPSKEVPKMIGTTSIALGIIGFKRLEIGAPVFDIGDRYMVVMESLDGKTAVEVNYYKETLHSHINHGTALTP